MNTHRETKRTARRPASRVTTLNVNYAGRSGGKTIAADLYEAAKAAILALVPAEEPGIEYRALCERAESSVPRQLFANRSVDWYITTVKLDLEKRGLIRRVPGSNPQRLVAARR